MGGHAHAHPYVSFLEMIRRTVLRRWWLHCRIAEGASGLIEIWIDWMNGLMGVLGLGKGEGREEDGMRVKRGWMGMGMG